MSQLSPYSGATRITLEACTRRSVERFKPENDHLFADGQLLKEAAVYLRTARLQQQGGWEAGFVMSTPGPMWPWPVEEYDPSPDPVRNLAKVGALLAAEIDRLERKDAA